MSTELDLPPDTALAEKPLITLDPATYTAAVYKPFRDRLELLKVEAPKITYDIATTAGMDLAKQWRAKCKAVRIEADKEREARKAPITNIGKLLESAYKEIEAAVEPLEDRFDKSIKAQEAIKEAERHAKVAAELKRVSDIQDRIAELRNAAGGRVVNASSALILDYIADLEKIPVDDSFEEFRQQAEGAKVVSLAALKEAHAKRVEHEAEQARIKAEREELAELRRKQAAQEAQERARLAQEEAEAKVRRDAEEAQARAQRQAEEAEAARLRKIEEDRLSAERAELKRIADAQQADFDRQAKEQAEKQAAFERQVAAAVEADRARQPVSFLRRVAPTPQIEAPKESPSPPAVEEKRPTDSDILEVIAQSFDVDELTVIGWLRELDLDEAYRIRSEAFTDELPF